MGGGCAARAQPTHPGRVCQTRPAQRKYPTGRLLPCRRRPVRYCRIEVHGSHRHNSRHQPCAHPQLGGAVTMLGRLTLEAFKHSPITMGGVFGMTLCCLLVIGLLFYFKKWTWLWKNWLTSLDPKK